MNMLIGTLASPADMIIYQSFSTRSKIAELRCAITIELSAHLKKVWQYRHVTIIIKIIQFFILDHLENRLFGQIYNHTPKLTAVGEQT